MNHGDPASPGETALPGAAVDAATDPLVIVLKGRRRAVLPRGSSEPLAGWTTSLVVHLGVIVSLGLLALPLGAGPPTLSLTVSMEGGEVHELLDAELEIATDDPQSAPAAAEPAQSEDTEMFIVSEADGTMLDMRPRLGMRHVRSGPGISDISTLFGVAGQGRAPAGNRPAATSFFGVEASGDRFVFCVDGSRSMHKHGWEDCRQELMSAVNRLKPRQQFYVILFADTDFRMFGPGRLAPGLVDATPENVSLLRQWLYSFQLSFNTRPLSAVQYALELRPDAIYLLTDGQFQDGTVTYLKYNNPPRDADEEQTGITIHAIAFRSRRGALGLKRIAESSGGTYRYVSASPEDE